VTNESARFLSLKYQKAAKLQKLEPLKSLMQFCFDVFLFGTEYTTMQYAGFGYLLTIYVSQGVKFVAYDLPKEKKRDAAKKREIKKIDEAMTLVIDSEENKGNIAPTTQETQQTQ